jgi:hypothetical protein
MAKREKKNGNGAGRTEPSALPAMPQSESIALGRLNRAAYNPRAMPEAELQKLARGIRRHGMVQPIVARRADLLVIGGHQRMSALEMVLREKGLGDAEVAAFEVPCVLLDLSDSQAKVLNLALNKISGEWDWDKLAVLLTEIDGIGGDELAFTGFGRDETDDILKLMAEDDETGASGIDPDEALRREARRFSFAVATDEDAQLCTKALRTFGMTGPSNAPQAFALAMRAAIESKSESGKKRRPRAA